jgi:hypothetical protein
VLAPNPYPFWNTKGFTIAMVYKIPTVDPVDSTNLLATTGTIGSPISVAGNPSYLWSTVGGYPHIEEALGFETRCVSTVDLTPYKDRAMVYVIVADADAGVTRLFLNSPTNIIGSGTYSSANQTKEIKFQNLVMQFAELRGYDRPLSEAGLETEINALRTKWGVVDIPVWNGTYDSAATTWNANDVAAIRDSNDNFVLADGDTSLRRWYNNDRTKKFESVDQKFTYTRTPKVTLWYLRKQSQSFIRGYSWILRSCE